MKQITHIFLGGKSQNQGFKSNLHQTLMRHSEFIEKKYEKLVSESYTHYSFPGTCPKKW